MAPPLSPNCSTAVGLALMPSLCSIDTQCASLRAPSEPSALTRNFGTTNSEIPFTPSGAPGVRASTRWTMFSAISCSPHVIKIFVPKILNVPSPTGSARVRTSARSEPAWGSVRFIVPVHSPEMSLGTNSCFCSSVPAVSKASIAPSVSNGHSANDRFAAFSISMQAVAISLGRPWPPYSSGCCTPCQPPCPNCAKASLKPGVAVTTPSFQLLGLRSPSTLSGATTSPVKRALSSSTACAVSAVASSKPGSWATLSRPASSFITNSMSLTGA